MTFSTTDRAFVGWICKLFQIFSHASFSSVCLLLQWHMYLMVADSRKLDTYFMIEDNENNVMYRYIINYHEYFMARKTQDVQKIFISLNALNQNPLIYFYIVKRLLWNAVEFMCLSTVTHTRIFFGFLSEMVNKTTISTAIFWYFMV